MNHVLAVTNHKGGVGKTTTAVNIAHAFAEAGKEVLLIDLDPQGSATLHLGIQDDGSGLLLPCRTPWPCLSYRPG